MKNENLFTPPNHINFFARKLYDNIGEISDVSVAYIDKNGGGPTENHTHDHNHLFIVTEGEVKIILNEDIKILKKNESFLVKGNIPHSVWNNGDIPAVVTGITVIPHN